MRSVSRDGKFGRDGTGSCSESKLEVLPAQRQTYGGGDWCFFKKKYMRELVNSSSEAARIVVETSGHSPLA